MSIRGPHGRRGREQDPAFALHVAGRNVACAPAVRPVVLRAYQGLRRHITLQPFTGGDCVDRSYNRLNDDYEALHAICRFFLASCGPTHESGVLRMLPFLLPMASVFEGFVAEWLVRHLPPTLRVRTQERIRTGEHGLQFAVDIVLIDSQTGQALVALDTKYKRGEPASEDFHQIHSYTRLLGCKEGILIYPEPIATPLYVATGGVVIRSAAFDLAGDLERAGERLMAEVLAAAEASGSEAARTAQ